MDVNLLGVAALALFVILRGSNLYGDPHPWSPQPTPTMTALSFLNVSKYPPSLLYALVTLGPAVMLLPVLEGLGSALGKSSPFSVRRRCFSMSCTFTPRVARPWRSNPRAASAWGKWRLSPLAERRPKASGSASSGHMSPGSRLSQRFIRYADGSRASSGAGATGGSLPVSAALKRLLKRL